MKNTSSRYHVTDFCRRGFRRASPGTSRPVPGGSDRPAGGGGGAALTRVPGRREEAGQRLQTGHQEVLGQQVEGGLQGRMRLQRVLQAAALDGRQVLALWEEEAVRAETTGFLSSQQ